MKNNKFYNVFNCYNYKSIKQCNYNLSKSIHENKTQNECVTLKVFP